MTDVAFTETKRETLEGFAYESKNGQVVIDACATDDDHLVAKATHAEQPMHRCRSYLCDLIPKEWIGKRGTFLIDRSVIPATGEVVSVQVSFVPKG